MARTSIVKKAKGLQRYMMTCGFWRSKKWTGASLSAIGLQSCGISYCYEHGTDGWLPRNDLDLALGLRERELVKTLPEMFARDIWKDHPDGRGIEIVGFLDHNSSSEEIAAYRKSRSDAGQKGNHDRHHVEKGISDPECPLCDSLPLSQVRSDSDPPSDPIATANGSLPVSQASSVSKQASIPPPTPPVATSDGRQSAVPGAEESEIGKACRLVAERRLSTQPPGTIGNPKAWKASIAAGVKTDHVRDLHKWLREGASAEDMAERIEPKPLVAGFDHPFVPEPAPTEAEREASRRALAEAKALREAKYESEVSA